MANYRLLIALLEKELNNQEKLLSLLALEKQALVKLNRDEMQRVSVLKELLLSQVAELQEKCNLALREFNTGKGFPRLDQIIELCKDRDTQREITSLAAKLKSCTTEVKRLNQLNSVLIRNSLGIVISALTIMRSAATPVLPAYNRKGWLKGQAPGTLSASTRVLSQA